MHYACTATAKPRGRFLGRSYQGKRPQGTATQTASEPQQQPPLPAAGYWQSELSHVPALPHCTVSCRFPNTLSLLVPTPTNSMGQASMQRHYHHSKTIGPNFQSRIMLTSRSWGNAVVAGRERDAKFCPYHMVTR